MKFRYSCLRAQISILCLGFCLSCASTHGRLESDPGTALPYDLAETSILKSRLLLEQGAYAEAADLLRSVGQQGRAVDRMDEVLYLLGTARLGMGDPLRAARCYSLLRKYYPRSPFKFPTLAEEEEECRVAIAAAGIAPEMDSDASPGERVSHPSAAAWNGGAGTGEQGPLVTNVFYETDIRQALMDISAQTGVSIVPDAMVQGYVTAELRDVSLENALERLLSPLGLTFQKTRDYYLVGAPIKESPSYPLLTETRQIKPRYRTAQETFRMLPSFYMDYLRVDGETNTLTVTAPRNIIQALEDDLAGLDFPSPQIMIDAMVVEMRSDVRRSLGVDWSWMDSGGEDQTFRVAKLAPAAFDSLFVAGLTRIKSVMDLRATIRGLAQKGKLHIRANPRVATTEGHAAEIRIAREAFFTLLQGSVTFSYFTLEKIATGITLKITPYVGASAEITSDIETEVSDVVATGLSDLPVTSVRSVSTRIRVMNGETIVIGGLRNRQERKEENRIPYLGDIPVLGRLFGHTVTETVETEVVILITPYLMIPYEEFDLL
ncbi:MAG: hypothetical protein KAW17_01875 [Candidatus Eisenbacteria sp.]|nr:hypothetical protein [Candidatus Eisenbacteria bacterium]